MFFQDRITNIKTGDKVLEIGPGSNPYHRADAFLEKQFDNEEERIAQSGFANPANLNKPTYYYDGGKFPFKDDEFDYIVCSHVIEHVDQEMLVNFINEMQRVAKKGYIEFPTVFYELINYQPVHIWFMNIRKKEMILLNKDKFHSNNIHEVYRAMFYGNSNNNYLKNSFSLFKEIYFAGFEWDKTIKYYIVNSFEDLVNKEDLKRYKQICQNISYTQKEKKKTIKPILRRIINKTNKIFNKIRIKKRNNYFVSAKAQLNNKKLIKIKSNAEIKDYVIINTHRAKVEIGSYSQINPFTVIYGGSGVTIGNNVMIAPNCMIASGIHDYKQTVKPMRFAGSFSKGPIIIEDDVWIGANCTIGDGVIVKTGSVVAANSFLNKNTEPYSIYGGVPAKKIGLRK